MEATTPSTIPNIAGITGRLAAIKSDPAPVRGVALELGRLAKAVIDALDRLEVVEGEFDMSHFATTYDDVLRAQIKAEEAASAFDAAVNAFPGYSART